MFRTITLGFLALFLSISPALQGMEYVPACLKKTRTWDVIGTVTLALTVSGAIYCIEYWQDAPNRDLYQGVLDGDAQKVALALYDGAQHDRRAKDGSTLLHYAVRRGHHALIPLLTAASLNGTQLINIEDAQGNTPLYYAIQKRDKKMLTLLRKAGASIYCCTTLSFEEQEAIAAELERSEDA